MTNDSSGVIADISVVIPVYNSADVFPELYRRLVTTFQQHTLEYEIIAVLDGCMDSSSTLIGQFAFSDNKLKIIEFSRNFGHQSAVTAGLNAASGKHIAIIDDDLEDPPELIPQFLQKIAEGFDVVYGVRRNRQRSVIYRLLYFFFYRIFVMLSERKIPYDAGEFCVMTRRACDALISLPENNRYLRGMRDWIGFRQTGIEYSRDKRFAGKPGYSIPKYIELALNGVFSFSYKPLKFLTLFGVLILFVSLAGAVRMIYNTLSGDLCDLQIWMYLAICMFFLSGVQLIAIGIVGEYIARIYDEVKQRPQYVVSSKVNLERHSDG